jgi:hypothetical protein
MVVGWAPLSLRDELSLVKVIIYYTQMHKFYGDDEHFDVKIEDEMLFDRTQSGTTA